jgi:excinuclease ABC subunit C
MYRMQETELKKKVAKLPSEPGVYFFMDAKGKILYVGKATSLRDRVKSYLGKDLMETRGLLLVQMMEKAAAIDFIKTDSALEALILEANWIKRSKPYYNTLEKDDRSYNYVIVTKEDFPQVLTMRQKELEMGLNENGILVGQAPASGRFPKIKYMFGPYPFGGQLKAAMKIIRRMFPYRDAKCVPGQGRPCFNRQIGLCPGMCIGMISKEEYSKTIRNIRLFFEGKKKTLLTALKKDMKEAAKRQEFERAGKMRNTIFVLNHINDISLIKEEPKAEENILRFEAYDIAHISGTSVVGVMVAVENGEAKKSDYRKFRIRVNPGVNDTGALKEVLSRRLNHEEWPQPDVILVDGGVAQVNAVQAVLNERRLAIPVIGVTKNERHKPESFIGDAKFVKRHKKEIIIGNSEAHRFAIAYHRNLRGKIRGR